MLRIILVLLVVSLPYVDSAYCNGGPGAPTENNQNIWKQKPRFIAKHQFGKLYEIGTGTTLMNLLHVYGNPYQMGFAHGFLLKDKINQFVPQLFNYLDEQFGEDLPKWIPKFLINKGVNFAVKTALDLTYQITRPYTNRKYFQEMHGVADASGVDYKDIRRIHMFGELTKASCSMFGAWGNATSNGQTVQLRALDWDFNGPYRKYPLAVVYHPETGNGNAWMNIGFVSWLGVISGVNQNKMAVSQIGVYFHDQTFGKQSRIGNPFTFVLRDILQWDKNIDDSIHRLKTAKRTCNLILGVGDGNKGYFRGFQYSHSVLNVVNDSNPLPHNITWHPAISEVVYWAMDWNCPLWHARLSELLNKHHSNITAENTIKYILPGLNSGNLQAVVYDLTYEMVYFAYGYITESHHHIDAFKRPFIGINLREAFAEKI